MAITASSWGCLGASLEIRNDLAFNELVSRLGKRTKGGGRHGHFEGKVGHLSVRP